MTVYAFVRRYVPPLAANILVGAWYALLICLALFFSLEPQAEFRYMNL